VNPAPRRAAAQRCAAPRGVNSDVEIELRARSVARTRTQQLDRMSRIVDDPSGSAPATEDSPAVAAIDVPPG